MVSKDKEEKLTPSRGIVSDVPSDAVEHAKEIHVWAESHPEWKKQRLGDKPKIKNRCGGCAAFHTPFCAWEYKDMDDAKAYAVNAEDYACSNFFPRLRLATEREFEKAVSKL